MMQMLMQDFPRCDWKGEGRFGGQSRTNHWEYRNLGLKLGGAFRACP